MSLQSELAYFTGSLTLTPLNPLGVPMGPKLSVTDGVKHLMNNGYAWLVNDAAIIRNFKLRSALFISVELDTKKCVATYTDGNGFTYYRQKYSAVHDELDKVTFYITNGVVLLPSEH